MLNRKWCNIARGMIASVIGAGSWSVVLSVLTLPPPRYTLVFACSRSTISKKDQKTRTLPSSSSFSILSVAFSIEHIFSLFYSSLHFLLAKLEHVLLSYSFRFPIFVFTIHQRRSSTRGGD